jgi:uncharacterized repeat protein (TIGR03843 family)
LARKITRVSAARPARDADSPIRVTKAQVLTVLARGEMAEQGLLPYSSNHSFLVTLTWEGMTLPAVYKPRRGETPLWDFEWGTLCLRETAAYTVSTALGWDLVPPTVLRDGDHGLGSVQLFIPNNDQEHYFTVQSDARYAAALRRLALFDYVVNNADRKSGHCLIGNDRRLWAIDHGICFHTEYKLRTVIWEFSQTPIEEELLADLLRLDQATGDAQSETGKMLCRLLKPDELAALRRRTQQLLQSKTYPSPPLGRRNYPWPPV